MKNENPEPRPTYEEWLHEENVMTRTKHCMTIYELEDDIPRSVLQREYRAKISAESFVCTYVTPLFYPETNRSA